MESFWISGVFNRVSHVRVDSFTFQAAVRYSFGAFQYETEDEATGTYLHNLIDRARTCLHTAVYSKIPNDTEILLTHTPAEHILDKTRKGVRAGCGILARRMKELESCRLHVFGHIHEARGAEIGEGDKVHVNAAIGSRMGGRPVVVDLLNSLEDDSARV